MKKVLVGVALCCSTFVFADDIRLGQPGYGGNGCPQGTASAVLSPDQKTLTILFDQFSAEAGGASGRTLDRKSCNIAVPIHIPAGLSVAIFKIDYRGFNSLPAGSSSRLSVDYFFAGYAGPNFRKDFTGPMDQEYLETNTIPDLLYSPCGQDTIGRANASIQARTNARKEQTIATVDSADIKAGLVFHLEWKSC